MGRANDEYHVCDQDMRDWIGGSAIKQAWQIRNWCPSCRITVLRHMAEEKYTMADCGGSNNPVIDAKRERLMRKLKLDWPGRVVYNFMKPRLINLLRHEWQRVTKAQVLARGELGEVDWPESVRRAWMDPGWDGEIVAGSGRIMVEPPKGMPLQSEAVTVKARDIFSPSLCVRPRPPPTPQSLLVGDEAIDEASAVSQDITPSESASNACRRGPRPLFDPGLSQILSPRLHSAPTWSESVDSLAPTLQTFLSDLDTPPDDLAPAVDQVDSLAPTLQTFPSKSETVDSLAPTWQSIPRSWHVGSRSLPIPDTPTRGGRAAPPASQHGGNETRSAITPRPLGAIALRQRHRPTASSEVLPPSWQFVDHLKRAPAPATPTRSAVHPSEKPAKGARGLQGGGHSRAQSRTGARPPSARGSATAEDMVAMVEAHFLHLKQGLQLIQLAFTKGSLHGKATGQSARELAQRLLEQSRAERERFEAAVNKRQLGMELRRDRA
ncbi:hypothetical protein NLU13_8698 [Sarocladium strictum]|uniref:Uncharacterized protein n=1 Tax=Sarocladium strictum TaxID=5046 RepID=A0AA39GEJ5_SARSR|nr:hypothetical protein NLU13_8698 [Sarocladium strictum]